MQSFPKPHQGFPQDRVILLNDPFSIFFMRNTYKPIEYIYFSLYYGMAGGVIIMGWWVVQLL